MSNRCERCNEDLDPANERWLELDQSTNLFHDAQTGIPAGHPSQGAFAFGRACAAAVLKNGGELVRINRVPRRCRRRSPGGSR